VRELFALVCHPRREDRVFQLVVALGQLCRDKPALTRLAEAVQPLAALTVRGFLLVAEGLELLAAEQVGVARDDRRLLRHLLLTDANGAPFLGAVVEVPLELLLELCGAADGGRRHLEDSIQRDWRRSTSAARS
jgi:hypothetical protein